MCVCESERDCVFVSVFTNASARIGNDTMSINTRSLNGSFFPLTGCHTNVKEPNLSYCLPMAGRKTVGFIPFPGVLVPYEMQSAYIRIRTRVAVSISNENNHYIERIYIYIYII